MSCPRKETLKGEDIFGGYAEYTIYDGVDYSRVACSGFALIGHGPFAVESVRTCFEFAAQKLWMMCLRKNLALPTHQLVADPPVDSMCERSALHAKHGAHVSVDPFGPQSCRSVNAKDRRSHLTITQKARSGIGDIYFFAIAMGLLQVLEDIIKRLTDGCALGGRLETRPLRRLQGLGCQRRLVCGSLDAGDGDGGLLCQLRLPEVLQRRGHRGQR